MNSSHNTLLLLEIKNVTHANGTVSVQFGGQSIEFESIWLRDHCRCSKCYRSDTFQRVWHILEIPDSKIAVLTFDKDHIYVTWDDDHKSIYKSDFLIQFDYKTWKNKLRRKPVLWYGKKVAENIARISCNDFLNTKDGASAVFKSILDYGVALIENVDATVEATEDICKALGGVQHTMFGGMWLVHTKFDHADTAYTNIPLATHTDNTYFTEAAGLQIFQGLEHTNGSGGETILVDGFYGAQRLKEEYPEDYEFLTTFEVDAEYLEDGHHHRYSAPVIILNENKDVKQIRFNVYDRTPMAFASRKQCRAYYRALKHLSKYYENPSNQWKIKLTPGVVIAIDNFRVLHGRTSFTGNRVLCGSYVARSDWLDKARTLQLIE
ncbi:PREDICTED: trimethyllysine dioxygenase, mitochondrial isoform X2 [Papilio xuthus]|uniref:Trimethyllysine dioxygenase, mitochondrial n=1 Tax=Papilio xuthus TaxID=66420 RepID=A0AAJ7E3Y6_PAPXU|nr:PREDICTED: trimethyllysine dioxygenase, mitochondrial isoform X2 [Papilio xuthus]